MNKTRLEAFSDGVIAILITIMVLDLRHPTGDSWAALATERGEFLSYAMSFAILGIYWNNHHHMLHMADRINGAILWANLHLLFWLSLVPFVTNWIEEAGFTPVPTAAYGAVLLLAAIAYFILQNLIVRHQGHGSKLAAALGRDRKGKASPILYAAAIPLAFVSPAIAYAIYVSVTLMWLIPDRRIESAVKA